MGFFNKKYLFLCLVNFFLKFDENFLGCIQTPLIKGNWKSIKKIHKKKTKKHTKNTVAKEIKPQRKTECALFKGELISEPDEC